MIRYLTCVNGHGALLKGRKIHIRINRESSWPPSDCRSVHATGRTGDAVPDARYVNGFVELNRDVTCERNACGAVAWRIAEDLRLKISGWAGMERSAAVARTRWAGFEIKTVIVRVLATAMRPDGCKRVA